MTALRRSAEVDLHVVPTTAAPVAPQDPPRRFPRLSPGAGTAYETVLANGPADARLTRQVQRLTDHVLAQFPRGQRASLLIAGGPEDTHAADVAGLVARELARRQQRDTLLVDADGDQRVLSQRFAAVGELALTDVLLSDLPPRRAVLHSLIDHLHVLPYGKATLGRRAVEPDQVRQLVAGLKESHAYVIVSAGRSRDILVKTLGRFCDATYLVLQLGRTEQQSVIDAVDFFTRCGARLLGSVVTGIRA